MTRPSFALSMMLGAMAASLLALGFPPCSNAPTAVGASPNAALICPASSLAAELHPFRWFDTPGAILQAEAAAVASESPRAAERGPALRLETCNLSIVPDLSSNQAINDPVAPFEDLVDLIDLAWDLCGLGRADSLGWCPEFVYAAPPIPQCTISDASTLVADYRHSTGHAEAMRINLREGKVVAPPPSAAQAPILVSAGQPVEAAWMEPALSAGRDYYTRYYAVQKSADLAADWLYRLAERLTYGLGGVAARNEAPPSERIPVHTVSVVRRTADDYAPEAFELVSSGPTRFVYVRSSAFDDEPTRVETYEYEPTVTNSFEVVIDGPERFLFLRKVGFGGETSPTSRRMAVMLPRPLPAAATLGLEGPASTAPWLRWDYYKFEVAAPVESRLRVTPVAAHGKLAAWEPSDEPSWDCLAYARQDQGDDSPSDQIAAEEAASDGPGDGIQSLIKAQAASEGTCFPPAYQSNLVDPLADFPLPSAPAGCKGPDPVGCLTHRTQMRAERLAHSAAWSFSRLATVLEGFAGRLREAAETQEANRQSPVNRKQAHARGWLEPAEYSTASQRFLSELYLGL